MSKFEYVTKDERMPIKKFVIYSLNYVQTCIKDNFTFMYKFIGNELRSMITRDLENEIGYDYEIEIAVNDPEEYFTAKGVFEIFKNALNVFNPQYSINVCKDDEYLIQTSMKNKKVDNLLLQIDFIFTRQLNGKNYIMKYNNETKTYYWEEKSNEVSDVDKKEKWCKELNYWNEVRELYLIEKNKEENKDIKSRVIYEKVLNIICEEKGYEN